ncbi:uncharacterized protein LOC129562160 [Moschus berezovskii]|uniref:uncharacterized protein LOC129562160 n=1 Tax=Moschus berezovskii TaxID=68408 RepID=UPI002443FBD6|nr:uncharacterized protein LOC129562160 [Moschus berezovskii]
MPTAGSCTVSRSLLPGSTHEPQELPSQTQAPNSAATNRVPGPTSSPPANSLAPRPPTLHQASSLHTAAPWSPQSHAHASAAGNARIAAPGTSPSSSTKPAHRAGSSHALSSSPLPPAQPSEQGSGHTDRVGLAVVDAEPLQPRPGVSQGTQVLHSTCSRPTHCSVNSSETERRPAHVPDKAVTRGGLAPSPARPSI